MPLLFIITIGIFLAISYKIIILIYTTENIGDK